MPTRTVIPYHLMPSQVGDALVRAIQTQMEGCRVSHSEVNKSVNIDWPEGISCEALANPIESLTGQPGYDGVTHADRAWSITTFDPDGTRHSCAILYLDDVTAKTLAGTIGTIIHTEFRLAMALRSVGADPVQTLVCTNKHPIRVQNLSDVGCWMVESIQNDPGPEGRERLLSEAGTSVV
jgi:hypothetical protein